jgi:hypothetical protein
MRRMTAPDPRFKRDDAQQGVSIAWTLLAMKVANRMSTRNKAVYKSVSINSQPRFHLIQEEK